VVIAGGKKIPERDALNLAFNAVQSGAVGVDIGRKLIKKKKTVSMIRAVRDIVHENMAPEEAYKLYSSISGDEQK